MKKIDKKYISWGIVAIIVICVCTSFVYVLFNNHKILSGMSNLFKILMPVIDGIVLAYLITPILNFIEKYIIKRLFDRFHVKESVKRQKRVRAISIVLTLIFVIVILTLFFSMIIPQLILSVQSIIFQFPMYINNLYVWVTNLLIKNPELEEVFNQVYNHYSTNLTQFLQEEVLPRANTLLKTLSLSVFGVVKAMWNFIIGFIISIYMLASKETFCRQAREFAYACFEKKRAVSVIKSVGFIHKTFIGFLGGKIVDSVIIGIICFICTSIIGTPYGVLISCIVGVTNIIPFFGPYIGAIPSALLVLMVNPRQCLYFVIMILILQQIDGNIIGPKILGNSTGLSSFWVIFSITLFGGLFGVVGMIVGVPVFAVIYTAVKYWVRGRLKKTALQNMPASEESESDYDSVFGYLEDDLNTIVSTIVEEEMAENDQSGRSNDMATVSSNENSDDILNDNTGDDEVNPE